MKLIINNRVINDSITNILEQLRKETVGYLKHISKDSNSNVKITCPFHKNGQENHPSCFVYCDEDGPVEYGYYKCFTCGEKGHLYELVAHCFGKDNEFGKQWLIERFGNVFFQKIEYLTDIQETKLKPIYLDEKILDNYRFYHPYMFERKLTEEIILKFSIGFDKETNSITFPMWDINGNLISIARRNVSEKRYNYEKESEKVVYLLNYIVKEHITDVYVCESQINALTLWTWNKPAIALCGTGSKAQYEILKHSGIRHYILALDGDMAGRKGTKRFIDNLKDNAFIDVVKIPDFKDVNDLSQEEFMNLQIVDKLE